MLDARPINNQPSTMLFQFITYYIPLSSIFDWYSFALIRFFVDLSSLSPLRQNQTRTRTCAKTEHPTPNARGAFRGCLHTFFHLKPPRRPSQNTLWSLSRHPVGGIQQRIRSQLVGGESRVHQHDPTSKIGIKFLANVSEWA
jgi:hypothetical protein